jgi:hypothetical protein
MKNDADRRWIAPAATFNAAHAGDMRAGAGADHVLHHDRCVKIGRHPLGENPRRRVGRPARRER